MACCAYTRMIKFPGQIQINTDTNTNVTAELSQRRGGKISQTFVLFVQFVQKRNLQMPVCQ